MALKPISILNFDADGGLRKDKKSFLDNPTEFDVLQNAYVWRDEVRKREGLKLCGRLRRNIPSSSVGNTSAGPPNTFSVNLFWALGITETLPDITKKSLTVTVGAPDTATFADVNGDGTLQATGAGVVLGSKINYFNGDLNLVFSSLTGGADVSVVFSYHPNLPVLGIRDREQPLNFDQQTIFFDTKYAYSWNGSSFEEYLTSPSTWNSSATDFFWSTNYRGEDSSIVLFFVTNFNNSSDNPMRYTDGVSSWTDFLPDISASQKLTQARVLIPYYGRLLALNTWEGDSYASAKNFSNRCRFSEIGNPTGADAWRSDIFGRGGFVDAPTSEQIVSAIFLNNTLIVFFERTTWQLRYLGEYGTPFIFERISSDFGSKSQFSNILFSNNVLTAGSRALISATSNSVERIDTKIPDEVFNFQRLNDGLKKVHGIRNYERELVFWNYSEPSDTSAGVFPNKVLVLNYRNNTFAELQDSITCLGHFKLSSGITWDSEIITWDSEIITWDSEGAKETNFVVSGNQQGFIHFYQNVGAEGVGAEINLQEQESLFIKDIVINPVDGKLEIISQNHNLDDGDFVVLGGISFLNPDGSVAPTDLNNKIFKVFASQQDFFGLSKYDPQTKQFYTNFSFDPNLGVGGAKYVGGGVMAHLKNFKIQTKDFNPFAESGKQMVLSHVDLQTDTISFDQPKNITNITKSNPCVITSVDHGLESGNKVQISNVLGMVQLNTSQVVVVTRISDNQFSINVDSSGFDNYISGGDITIVMGDISVNIFLDSSSAVSGNISNNNSLRIKAVDSFSNSSSLYLWNRLQARCHGQYIRFLFLYNEEQMTSLSTHLKPFRLNALNIWCREGGKILF